MLSHGGEVAKRFMHIPTLVGDCFNLKISECGEVFGRCDGAYSVAQIGLETNGSPSPSVSDC